MTIPEMYQKRSAMCDSAREFLEKHTDSDGKISADDAAAYDKMEADIVALTKNIERHQRQNALNAELNKPIGAPILNMPGESNNIKTGRASTEYKNATLNAIRTNFKNVSNILQESIKIDGGYLVPDEWDDKILDVLKENNVMRKLATVMTTSGDHNIPIPTQHAQAFGVAENQPAPQANIKFGIKTLKAYRMTSHIIVTNELLYDNAFDLEDFIITEFADALASKEEDWFINGAGASAGSGEPEGFLTTAASDTTMIHQTAGTSLTSDDLIDLTHKLPKAYRKNAVFIMNDATLAAIRKLKDNNQAYIWQNVYSAGEPDRLLGYPVYTTPYMPTMAANALFIGFGDFSKFRIADRGARTFQQLNELYAANFCTGYLMAARVDGVLLDNNAVRVLKLKP